MAAKKVTKKKATAKKPVNRKAINRPSQITKKAPTKRLLKRRSSNTVPGYFPNPIKTKGYAIFEMSGAEPSRCVAIYATLEEAKDAAKHHAKTKTVGIYRL